MSDVPVVWKENRPIESFDVDLKGRLRAPMLFGFLTNAAWKHASLTDHGYDGLSERNQMWVLSKFQLVITKVLRWGEQLFIETWGKGMEKFYAVRDYDVRSEGGDTVASATSAWLILDQATHRPLRVEQISIPKVTGREGLPIDLKKVERPQSGAPAGRFRATFSDIDPNGHVTAMKYLAWMVDSHAPQFLETNVPRAMDISFLGEGALNDDVLVQIEKRDGFELCNVTRETDQKELCRARITWARDDGPSG